MCQFCGLPPGGHGLVTQALGLLASVSAIATALFAAGWAIGWRRLRAWFSRARSPQHRTLEQDQRGQTEHKDQSKDVGRGRDENG